MDAKPRLLLAAALAAPGFACAALPCAGWSGSDSSLELHAPNAQVVLRAAPEALAALRRALLAHCEDPPPERTPLDVGPLDVDAHLLPARETPGAVLELRLRLHADRLRLKVR